MRGDELFEGHAIQDMLEAVLGRAVADDHDPLARVVAPQVVQERLHARGRPCSSRRPGMAR